MAIARISKHIYLNDSETMKAFIQAFPEAQEVQTPPGQEDYKLFEIKGQGVPDDSSVVSIEFMTPFNGTPRVSGWDYVWYKESPGSKRPMKYESEGDVQKNPTIN